MSFSRPPSGISHSSHPRPCQGPPEKKTKQGFTFSYKVQARDQVAGSVTVTSPPFLSLAALLLRQIFVVQGACTPPAASLLTGWAAAAFSLTPWQGRTGEPACSAKAASRAWELQFRAQRARSYRDVARSRPRRRRSSRCPSSAPSSFSDYTGSAPVRAAAAPPVAPATFRLHFPPPPHRAPRSAALEPRDWRRGGAGSALRRPALRATRRAVLAADMALGRLVRPHHSFLGSRFHTRSALYAGGTRPRASQPAGSGSPRRSRRPSRAVQHNPPIAAAHWPAAL